MTGFSFSELIVVIIVGILFLDLKQLGQALRWLGRMKTKLFMFQSDLQTQLNSLIEEDNPPQAQPAYTSVYEWRRWGSDKAIQMPSLLKAAAARKILDHFKNWDQYQKSTCVALYCSLGDEVDTSALCEQVLQDNKILLLPYIREGKMYFAPVQNLQTDLNEGAYGIQEPNEKCCQIPYPQPHLILIPGRCFDVYGGRIGRGKGFYDQFLAQNQGIRVGLAFNGQVAPKKLNLASHDIPMDYLLTENQLAPRQSQETHD